MSDYLGNLAAKSLAPEPAVAVQPRLASRFEPVAPELREGPGFVETVTEVVAPPVPPPPTRSSFPSPPGRGDQGVRLRRVERSEEQATPKATPEERLEPSPEPLRRPAPARRRASAPVPAEVAPVQRAVARRSGVPFEASPPDPLSQKRERGNVVQPVVAKIDPPQRPAVIPVPVRQERPDTSPLSPRERGPGGEASRAPRPELHHPPEQPPVLPILQPRVTLPERDPFPARPEAPAPEPVIHVTIGRIEVRATPAPKAPARERQAARPPVDLEEYLRQRSRGEGR